MSGRREKAATDRLAACWQACAGIPTESLQDGLINRLLELVEDTSKALEGTLPVLPVRSFDLAQGICETNAQIVATIRGALPYLNDNESPIAGG